LAEVLSGSHEMHCASAMVAQECHQILFRHDFQVTEDVMDLAQDTYGNYVIQHSLQFGSIAER